MVATRAKPIIFVAAHPLGTGRAGDLDRLRSWLRFTPRATLTVRPVGLDRGSVAQSLRSAGVVVARLGDDP